MYFAVDLDNETIVDDGGEVYSVEQFKKILAKTAETGKGVDMTLMVQRLISFDFDFAKAKDFYND